MVALALLAQVFKTDLDTVLQSPLLRGSSYSAYVSKLDGTVLYEHNSGLLLIPASNEKLFTAAYALHDLGTEYHPVTRFWKLKDRVIVQTTGDPMLTYADLKHARDVLRLDGKLPVYLHQPYHIGYLPNWELDDLPNKYAAPVTAFTVDRGSFEVWTDSTGPFFKPMSYGTRAIHLKGSKSRVRYDPFARVARVYGPLSKEPKLVDTLSLPEPDKAAASILGTGFHETNEVPSSPPDFVLEGPMLPVIVKDCLVNSDNNLAENLLLLSAIKEGSLGEKPYETAAEREKEFLMRTVSISSDEVRPDDGSGLSRYNLATTRSLGKLLQWESTQPTFDLWKDSLVSPGKGTLKTRLPNSSFFGKTGTMGGVTALSGYLKTTDGHTVVISLIFNNHLASNSKIRELEDQFVRKIEASTISGTVLEVANKRESHLANPSTSLIPADRLHRPASDGNPAR
jgi:D-alanyl-D-alanine carboxypeptidase/D-alanyl-D-alanine-endopeptidase (penicillin-binding protein 4)